MSTELSTWVKEKFLQPVSGCHQSFFTIGQHYNTMNSSALPYYYHIFLHLQYQKLFLVHQGDSWTYITYWWYHLLMVPLTDGTTYWWYHLLMVPLYWGYHSTEGITLLRVSLYWGYHSTEGITLLRVPLYWGYHSTEGITLLRVSLYWGYHSTEGKIGRAHVWTPVTSAHLVCRLLLEKKNKQKKKKNKHPLR